jgi:hypothetical protein
MINTYNESSLHKTLKTLIAEEQSCDTEIELNGYICDAVTPYTSISRGDFCDIYEIQTHNLGKLLSKILTLQKNNNICVVYPLQSKTYIETYSKQGLKISKRKSPQEKNIYHLFDELTGIFPLLAENQNIDENTATRGKFKLEVIEVITTQKRIKTDEPVQLKNKSRRWKRAWYKEDTELTKIVSRRTFSNSNDFLALLPQDLSQNFTVKDVTEKLHQRDAKRLAGKMLWTFRKAGLITVINKKGNAYVYKKTPSHQEGV